MALKEIDADVSTIDVDNIDDSKICPVLHDGETVIYRGWMLNEEIYATLANKIKSKNAQLLTDVETYLLAHHLPNWYPLIKEFTPETVVFPKSADIESELKKLGWGEFFIKDYVKSLKTSVGSIIRKPEEISKVVIEMEKYKGEIEGGLCVRRVEEFLPNTEIRYFVVHGRAFASYPDKKIPSLVLECAKRIQSPFFSVDLVTRADGIQRVVEIGDGQVSDIVGWSPERFSEIWQHVC
jgi:hypothetical protein